MVNNIAILGGSGAIGRAFTKHFSFLYSNATINVFSRQKPEKVLANVKYHIINYHDEVSINESSFIASRKDPLDMVIVTTGILHDGELMPLLLLRLIFERVKKARVPFFVKPITKAVADKVLIEYVNPNINRLFDFIESSLNGKKWFLGEQLSGADIQMSFPLETSVSRDLINENYTCIQSFVKRIHEQPAYQAAHKKGGKYDYA